eukprot:TRINITY_DN28165_c0_g1_i1.p1 TRINITY_DN28165_c0_g1~~TRINITY_DN28165_c0_g1_i1.p1  ORF type:complete len:566 (+),score=47.61 TRINITY_DN28165_c0_g1_i1:45-1742(+)
MGCVLCIIQFIFLYCISKGTAIRPIDILGGTQSSRSQKELQNAPCVIGEASHHCNRRGNKKLWLWIESQWALEQLGRIELTHFLSYAEYVKAFNSTFPELMKDKTQAAEADAITKNTSLADALDLVISADRTALECTRLVQNAFDKAQKTDPFGEFCGGGISEYWSGTAKHASFSSAKVLTSWVSAVLKPINDLMVDGGHDGCGLSGGGLGTSAEYLKKLAKSGAMWENGKGRCGKCDPTRCNNRRACLADMGFSEEEYKKGRDGSGERNGARFGTEGYEATQYFMLIDPATRSCGVKSNFWNCTYWTNGWHDFPHGLGFNVRNTKNSPSNPAERMRNFDMPWLGGPSGSVVDRLISAIALSYESARVLTQQKGLDARVRVLTTGAYLGEEKNTSTYFIRDLAGIAIVEMVALIGGGHHSMGETLLGAHATLRALEDLVSELHAEGGRSRLNESGHLAFATFCDDSGFVGQLNDDGFGSDQLRRLYDRMQRYETGQRDHTQNSQIYQEAICEFVRHQASTDETADTVTQLCAGVVGVADIAIATECSSRYMAQPLDVSKWWATFR